MKSYSLVGLILLVLMFALSAASAVVYVSAGSTHPGPDGQAWSSAFPTIQAAINAGGGEIWVAKGTYSEAIVLTANVRLYGGFAGVETSRDQRDWKANPTIIDGGGTDAVSVTMSNGSVIDGFVVANATTGVYCENAIVTIANNAIKRTSIGIECQSGAATITANTFVGNSIDNIFCMLGTHTILGNRITGGRTGISFCHTSSTIANNFIMGSYTGIRCDDSSPAVTNNSIAGCNDGIQCYQSAPAVTNNIIAFNRVGIAKPFGWSEPTLSYNNFFQNESHFDGVKYPNAGISVDPQFVYNDLGDLHIRPESACRNAGTNAAAGLPAIDIDGQPRVIGGSVDIGADESDGTVPSFAARIIYVNTAAAPGGNGTSWASAYRGLQAAIDDVEAKVPAEIWVAAGSYSGPITLWPFAQLYGGFTGVETLKGERNWKTNVTVIDGTGTQNAVIGASLAGIDGFTVTNAITGVYSEENSPTIRNCVLSGNTYGVASVSGFPIIDRNTITANQSHGMLFTTALPTVTGNYISGNADYGIYLAGDSSAFVASNVIAGNFGGIFSFGSSPIITNNTIVDNTGTGVGAAYSSYPDVANNIIAFNSSGVQNYPAPSWAAYTQTMQELTANNVYGNSSHNYSPTSIPHFSDISLDPQFINRAAQDYHLSAGSPLINAGSISALPPTVTTTNFAQVLPQFDVDGHGRIFGSFVDIGADEYWPAALTPAGLKSIANRAQVRCGGSIVTAVWPDFFYVQAPNWTSGIRVNKTTHGVYVGADVEVTGVMQTMSNGERCISAASVALANLGLNELPPAGMKNLNVGGSYVWSWRKVPKIPEPQWMRGDGPSNIGLLVKVWGRITQIDLNDGFFYLDDGSAVKDDTQTEVAPGVWEESLGIRISHSAAGLNTGDYLMINGISSCYKDGGDPKRLVLPRPGELRVLE